MKTDLLNPQLQPFLGLHKAHEAKKHQKTPTIIDSLTSPDPQEDSNVFCLGCEKNDVFHVIYPLVNIQKTMENHHFFTGQIHGLNHHVQ